MKKYIKPQEKIINTGLTSDFMLGFGSGVQDPSNALSKESGRWEDDEENKW